mmetsp:Transcript_2236/g.3021  ORF Transcript_2236/g.3021 Transcript_2236/m.3021 type:complete len:225 (+) Transcript_2236:116-790(+)
MVNISTTAVALLATLAAPSDAFSPIAFQAKASSTALSMSPNDAISKAFSSSLVAGALILSNVFTPDAALASTTDSASSQFDFGPSSSLIAGRGGGRSGGRAGGRSSASSMRRAPPPSRSSTTINRTTIVSPSQPAIIAPVYSPPVMISPFTPFVPSPLGMGLGIAGEVGREMREYRQEGEIRESRTELQMAREREFQLEQRINQMEANQNAQNAANAAAAAAAR